MERLNTYSRPSSNNDGIIVDIEGLTVDLVTVCKAAGIPYDEFMENVKRIWNEVKVQVSIPEAHKN